MLDDVKKRPKRKKEEGSEESGPHPDAKANIEIFNRVVTKKVQFAPEIKVEVLKDRDEWMAVLFVHGTEPLPADKDEGGFQGRTAERKGAWHVPFHQPTRDFRQEFCDILNTMGFAGLLRRLDRPAPSKEVEDLWNGL